MPTTKQRRHTARRRLERQLVRRAEIARRRRIRTQVAGAVVGVLIVLGAVWLIFAKVHHKPTAAAAQPSASATPSATASGPIAAPVPTTTFAKTKHAIAKTSGACKYTETATSQSSPYTKDVGLPPDPATTPKTAATMTLATSQGTIAIKLDPNKAPCTVQSFRFLLGKKFFDGTYCHRLTTSASLAVLQCGDPSGSGQGGPTYQVKDEGLKGATYKRGTVAMANSGPNTNGSQFFLVYKDSQLPASYTPIGTVSSGLDVLDKIGKAGTDNSNSAGDGKPVLGVKITSAKLS